ncbi:MAG TPA: peptide chain release factor 3 [Candidatus Limnocylindria bacterium]|nr:peptide chain release factor 3 [Candidatus Limnocylindria bacterium]
MIILDEIHRRRTFAIISHPDAGKTTLTEKLLLYGGAVQLAGSVTARKNQRATTSDWMELEKKRGISISSTVLQFDYAGYRINLLDTPGHKDFSEDTYRVLTAVDAVIMVIDAGKGVEAQTRKLFEVCARRGVPIFTFMNKLDRPARDPIDLLDEAEKVLGIQSVAMNWPLGDGPDFRGVYDRQEKRVHLFERVVGGMYRAPVQVTGLDDPTVRGRLDDHTYSKVRDQLELLEMAGTEFNHEAVLAGNLSPVFFGSGVNNFGVQLLLDSFLRFSSEPQGRRCAATPGTSDRVLIEPTGTSFSGFIFKIQANMDPRHRDRIAFVRIVSGKFERDMVVTHVQSGRKVRLSSSHKLFGNERETVDEAYPGDIIGLVGHDGFGIGDTLTTDGSIRYDEIPRFTPEVFEYFHNPNTAKFKQFRQGLDQLLLEGVAQAFHLKDTASRVPLLAAVGPLQFEVLQYRLETEYSAETRREAAPFTAVRWLPKETPIETLESLSLPTGSRLAFDNDQNPVALFPSDWSLNYFAQNNPSLTLSALAPSRRF